MRILVEDCGGGEEELGDMEGGQSERKVYPVAAVDYTLLEEIGQGVSATVFRALCVPYNEVVAIKSLDLEKCNSSLVGGPLFLFLFNKF